MEQIVVGMADCRIGDTAEQVLATYALGSCIGLAVHDARAHVGGLLHFMLPDSSIDRGRSLENPWMFADTGIPMMIERVCARGASKRRLTVRAAGGASMLDRENVFDIGRRNYLAMRKILWKAGILLHGEAVGGERFRTVRLEIGSGRFLIQEAGEVRELPAGTPQNGGSLMAYRVLIVDDSPVMRSFVRRVIEVSGFEVSECFEAANGREALNVLRTHWVDAILTDVNMPGMDGEEFLRRLAADDLLRSIPAIVISTDATSHRIAAMASLGARGYVTKPFVPETLRAELERTLGVPCD